MVAIYFFLLTIVIEVVIRGLLIYLKQEKWISAIRLLASEPSYLGYTVQYVIM